MTVCSTQELARDIGLTDRRVRQLADEGIFRRLPDGQFNLPECRHAYRIFSRRYEGDLDALFAETSALASRIEREMDRLARLAPAKREAAAGDLGKNIGTLTARLELLAALQPEGPIRDHHRGYVRALSGGIITQYLDILGLEVLDDVEGA